MPLKSILSSPYLYWLYSSVFFPWKVKHLLAQKAKNIVSPYSGEAPCVLVWPSQSSGNHFTFWGETWGTQGWDMPTLESSIAGHPALQLLLALAKYAFSWARLPSAAYLWHHYPCVTENYWKLRQQGKADESLLGPPACLSSPASRKEKLSITKISWVRQPQVSSPIVT